VAVFVAIDFETADDGLDSACAVALVRVEGTKIAIRERRLIRPPRKEFRFTHVHGLAWDDVKDAPTFAEVWPTLVPLLHGADFLAAHNADFDRGVLHACCRVAGIEPPTLPFRCTVRIARVTWGIFPTRLPDVCRRLGLPLDHHHDALADAEACASIVVAAKRASR
jgi:DNA polymerase-3 subunit epsilon